MTVDGQMRGLFTQIPWSDAYSGWVCINSVSAVNSVSCVNHYMSSSQFIPTLLPESLNKVGYWECTVSEIDISDST